MVILINNRVLSLNGIINFFEVGFTNLVLVNIDSYVGMVNFIINDLSEKLFVSNIDDAALTSLQNKFFYHFFMKVHLKGLAVGLPNNPGTKDSNMFQ